MRITSKGQVTVPKALRERFGITRETDVRFVADEEKLVLVKEHAIGSPAARIRGRVKRLPAGRSVDEYLRHTRGAR
jgi:AbrB family looped-hinge helix DNA binding protein